MNIEVKSKTKDEATRARIVRVKLSSSKSFETPTRSATSTEHNYKIQTVDKIVSSLGLGQGPPTSFENEIFQISKLHDIEQLQRFLKKNGTFSNAKNEVVAKKKAYNDKLVIYYPAFSKKMFYEDNLQLGIENLTTLIDFQVTACNLENISIPESHPNQSFDGFKKDLQILSKRAIGHGGKQIIPYLDMGMEHELFIEKYRYLIDSGYPVIGTVYRSLNEHYPNFRYLQDRDDDILIICSGVNRYWQSNWTTAYIHVPNFWGIDVTSLESKPAPPKKDQFGNYLPREPKLIDDIKRFDQSSLGIIKLKSHKNRYGTDLNCDCAVCSGKNIDDFKNEYSRDSKGNIDTDILETFCKLHETYASTSEFNNERKFIEQDDSKTYIDYHQFLNECIKKNKQ